MFATDENTANKFILQVNWENSLDFLEEEIQKGVVKIDISQSNYNKLKAIIHKLSSEEVAKIGIPTIDTLPSPYINQFIELLKINAFKRLQDNLKLLQEEEAKYKNTQVDNIRWQRLRQLIEQDRTLASKQKGFNRKLDELDTQASTVGGLSTSSVQQTVIASIAQQRGELLLKIKEIQQVRQVVRSQYPALAVLDTQYFSSSTTNENVLTEISQKFNDIRKTIADLEKRLSKNDIPLNKLTPIVEETKKQMGVTEDAQDEKGQKILDWLKEEQKKEDTINLIGTLSGIVLSVASFFTAGVTSIFLGIAGFGVGLGTGVYNLEIADDLNAAAEASTVGKPLVKDSEEARLNYFLSWVNVFLAGLDLGVVLRTGSSVIKGAQAAKQLVRMEGAEVLHQLSRKQIAQFDQAIQLQRTGKVEEADKILKQLKENLGEKTFN
ncbi:hypothetical protein [Cylindrospermum stagnale]|nr:hypothetical protein [Cylindrospermum stagnale]